jgi:uncharacterized membrane protein YphA (DoxX/SURF4 family)
MKFSDLIREHEASPERVGMPGIYVFGISSVASGILDVIWKEFEPAHQPVQALSEQIADVKVLVYLGIFLLIAGGAAIFFRRTARYGAVALAVIYAFFGVCALRRFYTAPLYLGYNISVYIGVLGSIGEQFILVLAAMIIYSESLHRGSLSKRMAQIIRLTFGLIVVDFGLTHLTGIQVVVSMIPAWMPFGGSFWAVLSGICFVLAGVGILSGLLDVLAARLLALMLLIFNIVVLIPLIFVAPQDHVSWGANVYNLTVAAAAWIMADWLSTRRPAIENVYR